MRALDRKVEQTGAQAGGPGRGRSHAAHDFFFSRGGGIGCVAGNALSYQAFQYDMGYELNDLSLDLRTTALSGMLLFAPPESSLGGDSPGVPDILALYVQDGRVSFQVGTDGKVRQVTSNVEVADGRWHRVVASRTATQLLLTVDGVVSTTPFQVALACETGHMGASERKRLTRVASGVLFSAAAQATDATLDVAGMIYVGSMRGATSDVSALAANNFKGCLRSVVVDGTGTCEGVCVWGGCVCERSSGPMAVSPGAAVTSRRADHRQPGVH